MSANNNEPKTKDEKLELVLNTLIRKIGFYGGGKGYPISIESNSYDDGFRVYVTTLDWFFTSSMLSSLMEAHAEIEPIIRHMVIQSDRQNKPEVEVLI